MVMASCQPLARSTQLLGRYFNPESIQLSMNASLFVGSTCCRSAAVSALAFLICTGQVAFANSNDSNSNQTAESFHPSNTVTPQYTDRGSTTYTQTTTNNYVGPYNDFRSSTPPGWQPGGMVHSSVTVYHRPVYFPPLPPALGEPVRRRQPVALGKFAAPATLANYVYESFYAPLSTLLFTEDLSRKRRDRLDAYRASRIALLTELRTKLESLRDADQPTRARELAALANQQAAGLAALNAAAEELRANLCNGSFFESSTDWNDMREWRLGDDTRWESQIDEIKVMRGSAAFQDGLSTAQRHLLREIEMELIDSLNGPTVEIALDSPGPFLYFSPATARIRIPADIPPELAAKIESYKSAKAALKTELRNTLYAQDRAWFNFKRVNALKALAERQAPRFAALEELAEEIRRDLVPYPNPARPPALPLPASAPRIRDYQVRKVALQTMLVTKLEETKLALPDDRVEYTKVSGNYVLEVVPNRRTSAERKAKRQAVIDALAPFNAEQTRLYAALGREKEALRAAVMQEAKSVSSQDPAKSIDQLLKEFAYAFQRQEAWEIYRDYETAVLEPGLSPAQRELLFGSALEKLDLPLAN